MKQFNSTIATLTIAAAGVFAVAGTVKADSTHRHAYSHLPHTHAPHHGYSHYENPHTTGNSGAGNAIVLGGLLIGGIALLDALSNSKAHSTGYHEYTPPKPVLKPTPQPAPVEPKSRVDYTSACRDHNHISISWDARREFSLRRPNGSVLQTINAGRPVMKRVAHALDTFGLDTTCVIKTVRKNKRAEKTRLFLSNGRLARVPNTWSGADAVVPLRPETLQINKVSKGHFNVKTRNGRLIDTFESRKQARAFIAFLDEKNARKKVVIANRAGEEKFAFYAR